jgi:hypothetical protein
MVKRPRLHALLGALSLSLAIAASPALAQPPSADAERAQTLFNEGRTALERGDYPAACKALSESLALVVRSNTLFNLAQCEEHEGRLLDAHRHWQQGIELLPPEDQRLAIARARVDALGRRLPRLTIQLAGDTPAETKVEVDGRPVAPAALAQPILLDPGTHAVTVSAPGHAARRLDLGLAEGEAKTVLLSLSATTPPPVTNTPPPITPPEPRGRPAIGWVLGGVGVAGLVVAGVTGGMLVAKHGAIDDACPKKLCSPEGRRLIDSTGPLEVANAAGWIAGAAGIGAGALVLLLGGRREKPRASVVPAPIAGGGAVVVTGSF